MRLFVGLGNPGAKYLSTRHNIGFLAVERIAAAHGLPAERQRFQGRFTEGRLGSGKIIVLKPETFMNLSGQSVGEAMRYYRLSASDVVVFQDELDLAPGKIRIKKGGGHAGHNGLRSLHEHIGPEYARVRIGIGHPGDKRLVSNYVLHDFAKADWEWIDPLLDAMADGAPKLADGDDSGFMTFVAQKLQPPKPAKSPDRSQSEARSGRPAEDAAPRAGAKSDAARPHDESKPAAQKLSALQRLAQRFSRN